jgi:signal transduction histidine kinase
MRLNSLAFRLIATSAAWLAVVLPIAGYIIFKLYSEDVRAGFDQRLEKLVNSIAVDALLSGGSEPVAPLNRYEPLFEEIQSGWYWQIKPLDDPNALQLVSASLATASLASPYEAKIQPDPLGQRWMNTKGPAGEPIRVIEIVDTKGHQEKAPRYAVSVAGPVAWLESRNRNFQTRLTIALALTGLGLVTATLFQVRFGLLPLQSIEKGLAGIRSGDATRLEGALPIEIEPLQSELNALIQSNQDIIDRARTQVGNLAHALKTPLAVITNEAREDKGPIGAKVAEQAGLMRNQINLYLERARMAARSGAIGRATDVKATIEPIVRALERINRDRDIRIDFQCPDTAKFQGEKQDLEEMAGNLLDNACKWARSAVRLTVSVEPQPEARSGRRLVLTVSDDGPGLSPEERAKLGKRGLRLDETKPGSGLGLSIVTDLAGQYRGRLALGHSGGDSGMGGLEARLELPAAS